MTDKNHQTMSQYSLPHILGIWIAAALPMALLGWVVNSALAPSIDRAAGIQGIARVVLLTLGLMWQFILSMIIVYREAGNLSWSTIRQRLWLNTPRDPRTGEARRILWLWLIPLSLLFPTFEIIIIPALKLNKLWVSLFPIFAEPPQYSFSKLIASPEFRAQLVGAWWFFGLFIALAVFNTFLGEEFLFRGVLLPRMNGAFGQWDWVANGFFFGIYHWHQPWGIPGSILVGTLLFALPAKYFRSTWTAIVVHSGQSVFFGLLIIKYVLGSP
jgi:membrane protease YdiL (CAAX protease family)